MQASSSFLPISRSHSVDRSRTASLARHSAISSSTAFHIFYAIYNVLRLSNVKAAAVASRSSFISSFSYYCSFSFCSLFSFFLSTLRACLVCAFLFFIHTHSRRLCYVSRLNFQVRLLLLCVNAEKKEKWRETDSERERECA